MQNLTSTRKHTYAKPNKHTQTHKHTYAKPLVTNTRKHTHATPNEHPQTHTCVPSVHAQRMAMAREEIRLLDDFDGKDGHFEPRFATAGDDGLAPAAPSRLRLADELDTYLDRVQVMVAMLHVERLNDWLISICRRLCLFHPVSIVFWFGMSFYASSLSVFPSFLRLARTILIRSIKITHCRMENTIILVV